MNQADSEEILELILSLTLWGRQGFWLQMIHMVLYHQIIGIIIQYQSTENVSVFNNSANRITTSVNLIDNTNNQTPTSLKIKNAYGAYYAHRNDNLKILFNYFRIF